MYGIFGNELIKQDLQNSKSLEHIMIDRKKVKEVFASYVSEFDAENPKINLKIKHTYKVADICEQLAKSIELSENDVDLAWLLGMLHDIGRFEQLRRFNTFTDSISINHAQFGVQLLTENNNELLRKFTESSSNDDIIISSINVHSDYRIPEDFNERQLMFANLLRDADKIDILRANLDTPYEDIYNCTKEELYNASITPEVVASFHQHTAVLRSLKKTPVDNIIGHLSLIYELVFDESKKIIVEQGYWEKLADFNSGNKETKQTLKALKIEMTNYLNI